jgi:hypothetical protein
MVLLNWYYLKSLQGRRNWHGSGIAPSWGNTSFVGPLLGVYIPPRLETDDTCPKLLWTCGPTP